MPGMEFEVESVTNWPVTLLKGTNSSVKMHSVSSKNSGLSSKGKVVPKLKGKPQKPSSNRLQYFINCKHDLKHAATCPMCKLINIVTRKHFDDEREQIRMAHEQSHINRAQLRLTLMLRWARSQSVLYNKYVSTPTFDIVFSKSLSLLLVDDEAVSSRAQPIDFDEIVKVLERRNRIQEVGQFAAVYLQSRIRKYLAKRYVRRLVLLRFEYVPATRRKEAFYIDNYWKRKWMRTPRMLQQEAPATPRTMGRRIAAEDRLRDARFDCYQKAVKKQYRAEMVEDVWAQEETTVRFLKQLCVLRDLVRIAMLNVTRMRTQREAAAEKLADARRVPATPGTGTATPNRKGSVMGRSAMTKLMAEETPAAGDPAADAPVTSQPVWICLSAPSTSARQFGLSLALATVPSPATGAIALRTDSDSGPRVSAAAASTSTGRGSADSRAMQLVPSMTGSPGSPGTTVRKLIKTGTASTGSSSSLLIPGAPNSKIPGSPNKSPQRGVGKSLGRGGGSGLISGVAQLQRSLQFLETSIWNCLKCSSPDEVLSKLLLEDLRPTYESVMNISQDDKFIWHGKIGYAPSNAPIITDYENSPGASGLHSSVAEIPFGEMNLDENSSVGSISAASTVDDLDEDFANEVLPLSLQLRPFYTERTCNGFFRLFFYMDELIVVSAVSPWAFYPEVLKNRDMINNSIRAYAAMPATKMFIHQYLQRANLHTLGKDRDSVSAAAGSGASGGFGEMLQIATAARAAVEANTPPTPKGPQKRPSVMAGGPSVSRKKSMAPPPLKTVPTGLVTTPELTYLFAPPEELIFGNTAPDRAAIQRMRDISQFSDDKTLAMHSKYKFLSKNTAFVERLKRAEHNAATRQKRRGAATSAHPAAVPSKAFMENSPFHQRVARMQQWYTTDPYLSQAALQISPLGDRLNNMLIQDLHNMHDDLLGRKLMRLMLGPEAADEEEDPNTMNIFDNTHTDTSSLEEYAEDGTLLLRMGANEKERALPEYEAKLHRYSSKARVEIGERLRRPPELAKVRELFPLVVMDVYVQLPGKAGLSTAGSTSSLASSMSAAPSPANLQRTGTNNSAASAARGGLSRGGSTVSGAGSEGGASMGTGSGSGLLGVDLQQIVGAFSCETDRSPPNLDCGLAEWEHLYALHQLRVATAGGGSGGGDAGFAAEGGFAPGSITRTNSVRPAPIQSPITPSSSGNVRNNYWTTANSDTGISTYLSALPSGLQYQFHVLGATPSKPYLEKTLPKKVKEWLGLPV